MVRLSIAALLLSAASATARICTNLTIPVEIKSRQGVFREFPIRSNFDTQAFAQDLTRRGHNYSQELFEAYQTLEGIYNIYAQYCHPSKGPGKTVQLLTHGIGFDRTYWDLSYDNWKYSYVETAVASGYTTLAIDRLGIGNSSHGHPLHTIQSQAEVEVLNELTKKLRKGQIAGISRRFKKVIHVGHSFGSILCFWLSALYPDNTNGLVLTGFSPRGNYLRATIAAWNLHSARLNQPFRLGELSMESYYRINHLKPPKPKPDANSFRFIEKGLRAHNIKVTQQDIWETFASTEIGNQVTRWNQAGPNLDYPPGYLVHSDLTANQYVSLHRGNYDIGLAVLAEQTKQPVTVGELLTVSACPSMSAFAGPVFVFTGDKDWPFCGGDCRVPTETGAMSIPDETKTLFPKVEDKRFGAYLQPDTAHALTLHYNATAGYKVIQDWLHAHKLKA